MAAQAFGFAGVGGVKCHSVAYFERDGVSMRVHSEAFDLADVLAYVESVERDLAA